MAKRSHRKRKDRPRRRAKRWTFDALLTDAEIEGMLTDASVDELTALAKKADPRAKSFLERELERRKRVL